MADPSDPVVERARAEIDALDRAILDAVNRRLEVVDDLHRHKVAMGYPMTDPGREERIVARLGAENPGPLSDDGVRELVHALIGLSVREARRLRGG